MLLSAPVQGSGLERRRGARGGGGGGWMGEWGELFYLFIGWFSASSSLGLL